MLLLTVAFQFTKAQGNFSHTTSNSTGAVVNTGIDTSTYTLYKSYTHVAVQPKVTKVSGTVAGTSILYYSVDGSNWIATGDTLTNTNQTTNTTIWNKISAARYWQIRTTGSGTMSATTAHKIAAGD